MRISAIALLVPLLVACSDDASVISGALLDSSLSGQVWIDEEAERFDITNGSFLIEGEARDTLDLQFSTSDGETGRMRILGMPGGAELTLDGVWLEGGMAFATDASLGDDRVVDINSLRMGALSGLTDGSAVTGTLLAVDDGRESLMIRPDDSGLPDLRIVVGETTQIRGADDVPSTLERLEFGDSISVTGEVEGRYLLASLLTLSRSETTARPEERESDPAAVVEGRDQDDDDDDDNERDRVREEPRRAPNAARGRGFRPGRRDAQ